ncbi:MAG: hypothetical protein C0507_00570 [Cyanobacteria bacterium PR.3.49]|nr:hypothetical protein [Cyanobacteria bacterium PR.3.49]
MKCDLPAKKMRIRTEAQDLIYANRIDEALASLDCIIARHPDDGLAYAVRGDAHCSAGDYGSGLED